MSHIETTDSRGWVRWPIMAKGFRPFFLVACVFSTLAMSMWMGIYHGAFVLPLEQLPSHYWHAHSLIFGMALAVIAGFVLTAVTNWTGRTTLVGGLLVIAVSLWIIARIITFLDAQWLPIGIAADASFGLVVLLGITRPIVATRQWKQMAVISKFALLVALNLWFYYSVITQDFDATKQALLGGFYLVIGLILTIGRRVFPFFTERGLQLDKPLYNSNLVDRMALVGYLVFYIAAIFVRHTSIAQISAIVLFFIYSFRMIRWHNRGIWLHPMLWSLYIGLWFITIGFGLYGLAIPLQIPESLVTHWFAIGGVGLMIAAMVARVSVGHTGRAIYEHQKIAAISFGLLIGATIVRVLCPLVWPQYYATTVLVAQVSWIAAFGLLTVKLLPIWLLPRPDGKVG